MRIALISLCRSALGDSANYCGLLRIGNDSLLAYQITLAKHAGAETILCHVDTVPGDLMRHEKMAQDHGMKWITIRHFGDLLANVMPDDELLVIGDGIYHGFDLFDDFLKHDNSSVLVAQADDAESGFERLDLNHVWAGLLLIGRDQLDSLTDVPPEWSLESVLLRGAMGDAVQSVAVSSEMISNGSVRPVESDDAVDHLRQGFLVQSRDKDIAFPHPLSNYLVAPLAGLASNWIWASRQRGSWALISGMIMLMAMMGLFVAQWSIAAAIVGYAGYVVIRIARLVDQPVPDLYAVRYHAKLLVVLASLAIAIALYPHVALPVMVYIALIWLFLQGISSRFIPLPKWQSVAFDPLLLTIVTVTAATLGQLAIAIGGLTLVQAVMLLIRNDSKG